jgi:hypothetical protein
LENLKKIIIGNEVEKDYRFVEELTREGFWNYFQPEASEHFILHNLRKSQDFIRTIRLTNQTFEEYLKTY